VWTNVGNNGQLRVIIVITIIIMMLTYDKMECLIEQQRTSFVVYYS
jgi:hypothetical protein